MPNNELADLRSSVTSLAEIESARTALAGITAVTSDAEARAADAVITPAKTLVKVVHDQRMAITRRIDAFKKMVIAQEADICADLNAELDRVKALQVAYISERERAAEAAREEERYARMEAEMEARLTGADVSEQAPASRGKAVAGVTSRTTWSFEVTDADSVPRAFCSPDETAIRQYMSNARKDGADIASLNIPGVRFFTKISV